MAIDEPDDHVRRLWHAQHLQGGPMSMLEINARSAALRRKLRVRNIVEYLAGLYVIAFSLRLALQAEDPMVATGMALLAAGALFVIGHMHVNGWVQAGSGGDNAAHSKDFYRAELVRQRDLLDRMWLWYLLPLAPGLALLHVARAAANPLATAVSAAGAVAVAVVLTWLNRRAARKLQRDIDGLGV
jgi:hypothetical protein